MLRYLQQEANLTATENGAPAYQTTGSFCLDLFADIGAIRSVPEAEITARFAKAYAEDRDLAMKILFFGRDVRGGLGERRVFRVILRWLADHAPDSVRKNLAYLPEYGRFDDLLALMETPCEADAVRLIRAQLEQDLASAGEISLLSKWLPSVNTSNKETVRLGKLLAKRLGMTDAQYRKTLSQLRRKLHLLENHLREKDYTFDYAHQPSQAMLKYRSAFWTHDASRYSEFLHQVQQGKAALHTGTLAPYEIVRACLFPQDSSPESSLSLDTAWNALPNFAGTENALVVVDGSGSMYSGGSPSPITAALSLGLYFAERNTGAFRDHFITFSRSPQLVRVCGNDIAEKVWFCTRYNEVANTDLMAVFELLLRTAVHHSVPQSEMPSRLYIVSDMEFDTCVMHADKTCFEAARQRFAEKGYCLPDIVFWNVASRNGHHPVTRNEQGVALVSGCTPRLFAMVAGGELSPCKVMMEILRSERYALIAA